MLAHAHVAERTVAARELGDLARHADASRDIVQQLHVDGVVGGALIESGGTLTLRVVIYDGDGNLKSLGETPLGGHTMSKDELDVLGENLDDELGGLRRATQDRAGARRSRCRSRDPNRAPRRRAETTSQHRPTVRRAAEIVRRTDEPHHDAAPTQTADAVSLDDVAALNNGADADATAAASRRPRRQRPQRSASPRERRASASRARSFSGPSTLMGYTSSPVGDRAPRSRHRADRAPRADAMAEAALGMTSRSARPTRRRR